MKISLLSTLTLLTLSGVASAAPTIWGVNDHAYEVITNAGTQGTYAAAKAAAAGMSFRGVQGRLVVLDTSNYTAELNFIGDLIVNTTGRGQCYWIGGERPASSAAATSGWNWVDGSTIPTSITSTWAIDQNEGSAATTNYSATLFTDGNYHQPYDYIQSATLNFSGGYVVEYGSPVPEPATMAALGLGIAALVRHRRKG